MLGCLSPIGLSPIGLSPICLYPICLSPYTQDVCPPYVCTPTPVISKTLEKVLVLTTFAQSQLVLVLTSFKFLGLEESRSRHISKLLVLIGLGLDNFCLVSAGLGLDILQISWSRRVSVSKSLKIAGFDKSRSRQLFFLSLADSLSLCYMDYQYYLASIWSNHA